MGDIASEKSAIRNQIFELRKKMDPEEKLRYDRFICEQLKMLIQKNNFKTIHAYIPIAYEIDITPLLEYLLDGEFKVVCPKTLPDHKLENRLLTSLSNLETGVMKTKHPAETNIYNGAYDMIIVPGLAFDKNLYRLGYGGGYYDNFILNQPEAFTVGIFYPFQEVDEIPVEEHDEKLNTILFNRKI